MKKSSVYRIIYYLAGLLILALGIILNTKSGLGVSPIISVAYSTSTILNVNFGNMTFVLYTVFVVAEMLLHIFQNRRRLKEDDKALVSAVKKSLPLMLGMDFLQLPLSLVFTRFMNLFSAWIPAPSCGTVIAVLGVGRVIALFNSLFMAKMTALAEIDG